MNITALVSYQNNKYNYSSSPSLYDTFSNMLETCEKTPKIHVNKLLSHLVKNLSTLEMNNSN